jgi:hypothetical protein
VILANVTGMALNVMADVLDLEWRMRVVVRQVAVESWVLSLVPGDVQGATGFVN